METHSSRVLEPVDEMPAIHERIREVRLQVQKMQGEIQGLVRKRNRLIFERAGLRDRDRIYWAGHSFIFDMENTKIHESGIELWVSVMGFQNEDSRRSKMVCYVRAETVGDILRP